MLVQSCLLGEIVILMQLIFKRCVKDLGFNVYYQTTVGDNHDRLKNFSDIAFKRVLMCNYNWWLGPTQDDLTKELSAEYLGLELFIMKMKPKGRG